MFHPRMIAHYFAYLCDMIPLGSMTFFAPTIVDGLGYDSLTANLMTVPPWIFGYCVRIGPDILFIRNRLTGFATIGMSTSGLVS